jgi:hypothetical protein
MDHGEGPLYILLVEREGQSYPIHYMSSFFFFVHSLFEFYIGEGGKKMMDNLERRGRIIVALALYWCLHVIVQHVLDMQTLTLNGK